LRVHFPFFAHSLVLIFLSTFYRKSPVFHQKSPTFHPKSPPFFHLHITFAHLDSSVCTFAHFHSSFRRMKMRKCVFLFLISHRLQECPNLGLLPLYIGCFAKKYSVHKHECSFFFWLPRVYMEANKPIQKMLGTYEEPIKVRR